MIYEYYTALLILIWPLNCIIDCCWCFNFNSCPCIYLFIYLFIKTHLINVKMYNHPVIITKWNHFWVIQAPCSSRQGLFWWIRVHSFHVYGYVYAYVLFDISLCFWGSVAELLFHIWMKPLQIEIWHWDACPPLSSSSTSGFLEACGRSDVLSVWPARSESRFGLQGSSALHCVLG